MQLTGQLGPDSRRGPCIYHLFRFRLKMENVKNFSSVFQFPSVFEKAKNEKRRCVTVRTRLYCLPFNALCMRNQLVSKMMIYCVSRVSLNSVHVTLVVLMPLNETSPFLHVSSMVCRDRLRYIVKM